MIKTHATQSQFVGIPLRLKARRTAWQAYLKVASTGFNPQIWLVPTLVESAMQALLTDVSAPSHFVVFGKSRTTEKAEEPPISTAQTNDDDGSGPRPSDITKTAVHDHCHLGLALAIIVLTVAVPMQRGTAPCPAWRLGLDSGGCFRTVFS
jgi:hypothetical protein